jgi:hypothetical protein
MKRAEFHAHVGDANILANVHEALKRAHEIAVELDIHQPSDVRNAERNTSVRGYEKSF